MKLTKYITIACIFSLVACSEPLKVTPLTYTQIFSGKTQKTWTVRNFQLIQKGQAPLTGSFDPCILDDQYIFFNDFNRTFRVLDGNNKCSTDDPDILADSNWSFVNATSTLTMVLPLLSDQALPFTVKEVEDDKMTIDIYLDDERTAAYRFNFISSGGGD